MSEEDDDQKTEAPTGKKLSQARESGNLPISREISNVSMIVGILVVLGIMLPVLCNSLLVNLRVFIEMPDQLQLGDRGLQKLLADTLLAIGLPIIMILLILLFFSLAGTIAQTGFYASLEPLKFTPDKLNPIKGWKTLASMQSLVELAKSLIKLPILGYIAYIAIEPIFSHLDKVIGADPATMVKDLHEQSVGLMITMLFIAGFIAVGDLFYRRFKYFKQLRMTKQEVKDEMKQSEGDPMIKLRMRRLRAEKARKRMMAAVPKADVVLTNPTHYAVALKYDMNKNQAPIMVAKGSDLVALRIRETAERNDVPVLSNPPLARAIFQSVEVDQEIKPDQYRAVAEIISYVYKLKAKKITRH